MYESVCFWSCSNTITFSKSIFQCFSVEFVKYWEPELLLASWKHIWKECLEAWLIRIWCDRWGKQTLYLEILRTEGSSLISFTLFSLYCIENICECYNLRKKCVVRTYEQICWYINALILHETSCMFIKSTTEDYWTHNEVSGSDLGIVWDSFKAV